MTSLSEWLLLTNNALIFLAIFFVSWSLNHDWWIGVSGFSYFERQQMWTSYFDTWFTLGALNIHFNGAVRLRRTILEPHSALLPQCDLWLQRSYLLASSYVQSVYLTLERDQMTGSIILDFDDHFFDHCQVTTRIRRSVVWSIQLIVRDGELVPNRLKWMRPLICIRQCLA